MLLFLMSLLLPTAYSALGGFVGRLQSVGVRGLLTCEGKPAPGVLVKLYDDDKGWQDSAYAHLTR